MQLNTQKSETLKEKYKIINYKDLEKEHKKKKVENPCFALNFTPSTMIKDIIMIK